MMKCNKLFTILWFSLGIGVHFVQASEIAIQPNSEYTKLMSIREKWLDDQNQSVQFSNWDHQYLILTMSYTSCRKICPKLTLQKLKELQEMMDKKGLQGQFVVVTFDPETDTPEVLNQYRKNRGLNRKNWHFLSGSPEATRRLADLIGLGGYYAMDDHIIHDFKITIYSPQGTVKVLGWKNREIESVFAQDPS